MTYQTSKRNFFQRIMGKPITQSPAADNAWQYADGTVSIDLTHAPELTQNWGAICLEGKSLPHPILVMQDGEGSYHAFCNKCSHGGRKLDPVPDTDTICCCSVGKSIFDFEGNVLTGSAKKSIDTYTVSQENGRLLVTL